MIGSGLPAPNGPARAIMATVSLLAPAAVSAPSISSASSLRAVSTADASAVSRYARKRLRSALRRVTPAAIAWPPPLSRSPSRNARRTACPRSTPAHDRPDPAPWSEHESQMPRLRRRTEARDIHQCGEAWALAPSQGNEPFGNESTIEPFEQHHIGDGAECNQVEEAQEVRLAPLQRPEAAPAQL